MASQEMASQEMTVDAGCGTGEGVDKVEQVRPDAAVAARRCARRERRDRRGMTLISQSTLELLLFALLIIILIIIFKRYVHF
jgi:hypothetical protein